MLALQLLEIGKIGEVQVVDLSFAASDPSDMMLHCERQGVGKAGSASTID
jgi:hypothetical protein